MHRYFIQLAYKGTNYHGWQIQNNAISVQEELNDSLSKLLGVKTETMGCGRTDAGVHAKEFYAHFDCHDVILEPEKAIYKINRILSSDIVCYKLYPVDLNAHARFDAKSRTYKYYIRKNKNPFITQTSYFFHGELDLDSMNQACLILSDYIDFSCFSKSNTQVFTNNCKIYSAIWQEHDDNLIFTISADRFLRNMVRAIVGTMLEVGKNKISIPDFREIIKSKKRSNAGYSVPAEGLFLTKIEYPKGLLNE